MANNVFIPIGPPGAGDVTAAQIVPGEDRIAVFIKKKRGQIETRVMTIEEFITLVGGGGGGSDKNYVHSQAAPSTTWVVNHNLGKRVAVNTTNLSGQEIVGQITWNSDNQVTIIFNQAVSGFVYCN